MDKQKKEIIIYSVLVFIGLICVGIILYHEHKTRETDDFAQVEKWQEQEENNNGLIAPEDSLENDPTNDNQIEFGVDDSNSTSATTTNPSSNPTTTDTNSSSNSGSNPNASSNASTSSNSNTSEEKLSTNDLIVLRELNTLETNTDTLLASESTEKEVTAKGIFITLVDFCLYGGKIKGVTFQELTKAGQEKALKIINSIDEKIEAKFPGYKETISSKTSSALKKASELIKKGAQNIQEFTYEKLGETEYNKLIEEKDELVLYTKNAWNLVKNFSSSIWTSTKNKLKEWYEKFRDGE